MWLTQQTAIQSALAPLKYHVFSSKWTLSGELKYTWRPKLWPTIGKGGSKCQGIKRVGVNSVNKTDYGWCILRLLSPLLTEKVTLPCYIGVEYPKGLTGIRFPIHTTKKGDFFLKRNVFQVHEKSEFCIIPSFDLSYSLRRSHSLETKKKKKERKHKKRSNGNAIGCERSAYIQFIWPQDG